MRIEKKIKRGIAVIISFLFMITLIQFPFEAKAENQTDTYIKIRYNREDGNYEGWNLWVWEDGKDGKAYEFIGEDEEGKFAVIETTAEAGKLGFIIRKSVPGNEWAENYFGFDQSIELSSGDKEIIVNHKEENKDFEIVDLNREFDNVNLNIHYYRFNDDYEEWDIWSWLDNVKGGEGYSLADGDEYGKIATINYENVVDADPRGIGVIVRKQDWSAKDVEIDRFIDLAYANNNGEINAYLVQSNPQIVFRAEDAIKDPAILTAKIDSTTEISFTTNVKLQSTEILDLVTVEENGELLEIESVVVNDDLNSGVITVASELSLTSEYIVGIEGYSDKIATLGKVFSSEEFEELYHFDGELGAIYSKDKTNFVFWSPTASQVRLALYEEGNDVDAYEIVEMNKGEQGTWNYEVSGDLNGVYYTYLTTNNDIENEVTDPYAKAVGVNGNRAMVIDMDTTDPEGWENDVKPEMIDPTDAIIYELHIRDFTIHESSGASLEVQGKYDGMWQSGTTLLGNGDVKTGVDHLVELGITHLHLLPTFDHRSIDETNLDTPQFNWGYDPQNYSVPEGSYSTNPYLAEVRVEEFKEMVMELHKAGIRVVMDVVYNHTGATADSHLNYAVPDYYYRQNDDGGFANGSGCGNEIASERSMVRKMIVESVAYWAEEYHIDGFRFDLMALHDIETMKQVREELNKIDESILVYGEGWHAGGTPLPEEDQSSKVNTLKYGDLQIAAFSDDMRDGIKGHVFEDKVPGFVNGFEGLEEQVKFGIVASTQNEQVTLGQSPNQYSGYATTFWANEPYQTVNYASAHDNLTLWDKLQTTNPEATEEELIAMNKMAAALVLTSQGIPFIHAGEELARTKVNPDGSFNHNSYNAPDSVNAIDWTRKETYSSLNDYYKGLIELRKNHDSFTMNSTTEIQEGLTFLETDKNVIAYTLDGTVSGDNWEDIAVLFNSNEEAVEVTLPSSEWTVVVNENNAGVEELSTIEGDKVTVPAKASYVLVDSKSFNNEVVEESNEKPVINAKDLELKVGDKFNTLEGVTATDKEDGDLTSKIEVIENTVDTSKAGEYKVTYKVVDSDSNESTISIKVTVTEKAVVTPEEDKEDDKLPQTGGTSSVILAIGALVLAGAGVILFKKKENKEVSKEEGKEESK